MQRGSGFENGKFRIYQQFLKGETNIKNADFLKNEYGIGGHTVEIGGLFQNHDSKGLTFEESKTNRKYLLKSYNKYLNFIKVIVIIKEETI